VELTYLPTTHGFPNSFGALRIIQAKQRFKPTNKSCAFATNNLKKMSSAITETDLRGYSVLCSHCLLGSLTDQRYLCRQASSVKSVDAPTQP
jgi:hypothetical protein